MAFCGADQVTDANFWVSTCRRYAAVLMLLVRRRSLVAVVEKEQESQGWMIEQRFHSGRKVDSELMSDCNKRLFYSGQQAANVAVLFGARCR